MYISENELQTVLQQSFFTNPVTYRKVKYRLYRGTFNTFVHTVRFNYRGNLNIDYLFQTVWNYLVSEYRQNTQLIASVEYDLLLNEPLEQSYYIWRANSNAVDFNEEHEMALQLTQDNIYEFVENATQINLPNLEIFFRNSKVTIDRPIAIVFSFYKL